MRSRTPVTPDVTRVPTQEESAAATQYGNAPADAPQPADTRRRRFLLALGASGAGAAAAAVSAAPAVVTAPDKAAAATKSAGYQETAHVRDYYRSARF